MLDRQPALRVNRRLHGRRVTGFEKLLQDHGDIHLVCKARYSHSCGWLDGKEIRKDIPDPAPYSAEAMSWHIEATRRDWIGEFIPGSRPPERLAIRATG